jgi:hypothetical protein
MALLRRDVRPNDRGLPGAALPPLRSASGSRPGRGRVGVCHGAAKRSDRNVRSLRQNEHPGASPHFYFSLAPGPKAGDCSNQRALTSTRLPCNKHTLSRHDRDVCLVYHTRPVVQSDGKIDKPQSSFLQQFRCGQLHRRSPQLPGHPAKPSARQHGGQKPSSPQAADSYQPTS